MSALLLRDIRLAMRAGGGFGLSLAFFLIVVVLVPLVLAPKWAYCRKLRRNFVGWGIVGLPFIA
jgi:heme exporter protein B